MLRKGLFILLGLLMCTCMSQKSERNPEAKQSSSPKIKNLIKERRFALLQHVDTVVQLKTVKTLIDGTTNEYYNKLSVVDTLDANRTAAFLTLVLDDANYDWEAQIDKKGFDPEHQFLLKGKEGQLTILLDTKLETLGFIDLLGQELITMANFGVIQLNQYLHEH